MNRRELFAVGGAGVVGLLFPQKVVSGRPVRILEGITDEEMAQKIAKFPQGPHSAIHRPSSPLEGYLLIWDDFSYERHCTFKSHTTWSVCNARVIVENQILCDIKVLHMIKFKTWEPSPTDATKGYSFVYYRRKKCEEGTGWFTDEQA